jgi:lipopolysaccharide export system protein LptA
VFSVKILISNKNSFSTLLLCAALVVIMVGQGGGCYAEDSASQSSDEPAVDNMIRITADRLITDTQSQNAEFIGHVHAIRGNIDILCDSLKIFYTGAPEQGTQSRPGAESIERIVAQGNVKINLDNQTATTQHAEWSPKEQTIILSGPGSKIVSGKNSITGSKITLHQADNRIQVEGGNDGRVEAQFFSNEEGLPLKQ